MTHADTMQTIFRPRRPIAIAAALALSACGGSGAADISGGGSASAMTLQSLSNGFGTLVPHSIVQLDAAGNSTPNVVQIRTLDTLLQNLRPTNPVLPIPQFEAQAVLPSGLAGNHFLYVAFSQDIDIFSVLDGSPGGQSNSGLTGAVSVTALDPLSGDSAPIVGRAFVDGETFVGGSGGVSLQRWVEAGGDGRPVALGAEGLGFPGTQGDFNGAESLVSPRVLVFVPDADGNLATHETFPVGTQVRMKLTTAVRAANGKTLDRSVLGSSTVGEDLLGPEIITTPPPLNAPLITPGNGDVAVDPLTTLRVELSEPVQPLSVGDLADGSAPGLSSAIKILFGPSASRTDMPFAVRPVSVFDLSVYELIPAFHFPGAGPSFSNCSTFSTVDVLVNAGQLEDLARISDPSDPNVVSGNRNLLSASTFFTTGEGPGIVNAPVMPDAILVGRTGANPGISVGDLNGLGQPTGNPDWVDGVPIEGNTVFPYNQNVRFQPQLLPALNIGSCTIDGGSAGVFTLTRDSGLSDLLVRAPLLANVSDMMIGHALDGVFNNALFPFGCQSGGGQICTTDGLKVVQPVGAGPNTLGPPQTNQFGGINVGAENLISWAPHPNPPPLVFPPLCVTPFLNGAEPTSVDHYIGPAGNNLNPALQNLVVPGDPFGRPLDDPPIPPSGLLTQEQNSFFLGPSQGQVQLSACNTYMMRQQIGHFLYVLDRQRREVIVFNSNRMTVIERITVADPTSMAIGTNLDFLAVSSQGADLVTFIDVNPNSSTFHQVVKNTVVGNGPRGIAWEPGNEDILVCNEFDSSLSIISAFNLEVRKVISSQLNEPFEVCVFPRQVGFAFNRQVYYAYILNRSGTVAMFESGPNGVNGWGFDNVIGIAPAQFLNPKTIQPDPVNLQAAAWIVHEGPLDLSNNQPGVLGDGAASLLFIQSASSGPQPLGSNLSNPQFRALELAVQTSIGPEKLSGVPVDIAFDNLRNLGGLPLITTTFSAGAGAPQNGKGPIRSTTGIVNTSESQFMFLAVPNASGGSGVIDVLEIGAGGAPLVDTNPYRPGFQSIPAPHVSVLADYFRQ